jgi:hypothetical protein
LGKDGRVYKLPYWLYGYHKKNKAAKFVDWEIQDTAILCGNWAQISPVHYNGVF